jgi:hypothetical protein
VQTLWKSRHAAVFNLHNNNTRVYNHSQPALESFSSIAAPASFAL